MAANDNPHGPSNSSRRSPASIALLIVTGAIGAGLLFGHREHLLSGDGLLIILLLVCVGSHFFLHGGHGHGGHGEHDRGGGVPRDHQ